MLKSIRELLLRVGTSPEMDGDLKLAVRVSNFFAFWSVCTFAFMAAYVFLHGDYKVGYVFIVCIFLNAVAFWFNFKHLTSIGRTLLHFIGVLGIFLGIDSFGIDAGYSNYYVVSAAIPFLIFSLQEHKRSIFLSVTVICVYLFQMTAGDGLFFDQLPVLTANKWVAIIGPTVFLLLIFIVFRWEMIETRRELAKQQAELVHNSNLMALGEMSAGIAHEINNPLQTLTLHNEALRRYVSSLPAVPEKIQSHFVVIDRTIEKISALIKGLKELARDASNDSLQVFLPQAVLDDVLNVSMERIKYLGIDLQVENKSHSKVKGQMVHLSQTLINLLNNSIDALETLSEKWIRIEVLETPKFVRINVIDAGNGIPPEFLHKIMRPFFTTKGPGKGTGLGLSISKSIIEKNGGRFYYDPSSPNTCFVLELPKSYEG